MKKVKAILPFVQGKKSVGVGEQLSLDTDLAYKLAKKGVVEFINKKEFTTLDEKIKQDEKEKLEEQEEKERKVAAILEKEFLEKKREELQIEVDSITQILGDADVYYKPYIALSSDLNNGQEKLKDESLEKKSEDENTNKDETLENTLKEENENK